MTDRPGAGGTARLGLAAVVLFAAVLAAQKFVEARSEFRLPGVGRVANDLPIKTALGVAVSVALLVAVGGVIAAAGRPDPPADDRRRVRARFVGFLAAGTLAVLTLHGKLVAGYVVAVPPAPGWVVAAVGGGWLAFAVVSLQLPATWWVAAVGYAGLVAVIRAVSFYTLPFEAIGGDMLAVIDRGLGLMFQGRFPYIDQPPPAMPYWPGTFLPYAVPKLAGADLRWVNLAADVGTVLLVCGRTARPAAGFALPVLLVTPMWAYYSAETQYPPSVFAAVLLARAWAGGGLRAQAFAVGLAVAVNQTFGVLAVFLFPCWVRWYGWRAAVFAVAGAVGVCGLLVGPFLVWDGREFLRVTTAALDPFGPETIAGRFSLRPAFTTAGVPPEWAAGLAVVGVFATLAVRRPAPGRGFGLAVFGYCVVLLMLHRTFTHYYLPVLAAAVALPRLGIRSAGPSAGSSV